MASKLEFFEALDNYEDIVLIQDGVVVDSAILTGLSVTVGNVVIDSLTDPTSFIFPHAVTYEGGTVNGIRLNLSIAAKLAVFNTKIKSKLTIRTGQFPKGVVWDANILTVIKKAT